MKFLMPCLVLEMPLHVEEFIFVVDEAVGVTAEAVHVAITVGSAAIGKEDGDLMKGFGRERPEIPHHGGGFEIGFGIALLGVDEVAEF